MAFHNIEKWTLGYALLKIFFKLSHNYLFYRKIEVKNLKNIPTKVPVIFAPNHQNALMDPLAIIAVTKGQTVFLARSDIFKNRIIASLLYFIKILPVYRMRDGISNLQKNDEVFDRMVDILKKGKQICILPEGNHNKYRRLRPLAKGMFRIALKAESDMNFKGNLHIVPVGIDYSDYYKARTRLFINFGKALKLADYEDIYNENPPKALNMLKSDLAERMSELMIDIQTEEHYELYMSLREIYGNHQKKQSINNRIALSEQFDNDKKLIKKLDEVLQQNPARIDGLHERVSDYTDKLKKLKLKDWLFNRSDYAITSLIFESFIMCLLSPLFLYGHILNYLPFRIPVYLFKAPKDPQFTTSLRFSVFTLLLPVYYLIILLIVLPFLPLLWVKTLFAISLPLSGLFAINYYSRLQKLIGKWRYSLLIRRENTEMINLKTQREEIIKVVEDSPC